MPGLDFQRMRRRLDYDEARKRLIHHLLRNAEAHESGFHNYLDRGYEELSADLPREGYPELLKLLIAANFWDAWIDASNHDWRHYKGIRADDWPRLARSIVEALEQDREIDDPEILRHFAPSKRIG